MIENFPKYVPSDVCLKCDGCCHFENDTTSWRAKIGQKETDHIKDDAEHDLVKSNTLDDNYLKSKPAKQGGCHCVFFNPEDHHCRIYGNRPFECHLYPFLLTEDAELVNIKAHLSCPYIEKTQGSEMYENYVATLKEYFKQDEVKDFIRNNKEIIGDYSEFLNEIEGCFNVEL